MDAYFYILIFSISFRGHYELFLRIENKRKGNVGRKTDKKRQKKIPAQKGMTI